MPETKDMQARSLTRAEMNRGRMQQHMLWKWKQSLTQRRWQALQQHRPRNARLRAHFLSTLMEKATEELLAGWSCALTNRRKLPSLLWVDACTASDDQTIKRQRLAGDYSTDSGLIENAYTVGLETACTPPPREDDEDTVRVLLQNNIHIFNAFVDLSQQHLYKDLEQEDEGDEAMDTITELPTDLQEQQGPDDEIEVDVVGQSDNMISTRATV